MKQDTALTSAIEKLDNILKEIEKAGMAEQIVRRHEYFALTNFKHSLIELLPKEKEQMEKCFLDGDAGQWGNGDSIQIYEAEELHNNNIRICDEYLKHFTQYTEPVKE